MYRLRAGGGKKPDRERDQTEAEIPFPNCGWHISYCVRNSGAIGKTVLKRSVVDCLCKHTAFANTMIFDIERHARTKLEHNVAAPGQPGNPPRWTTGAKTGVGTAVSEQSRIWFTISHGILNEVYFPSIDQANTRNMRFVVTDGESFVSDEEQDAEHNVQQIEAGVPAFRISTRCKQDRYRLQKEVITDPDRDVLLMHVEFEPKAQNLRLFVLLDPHVGDSGGANDAWIGNYKGLSMLFAKREQTAMALASTSGFEAMSCGFEGVSDGWTDLRDNKRLVKFYTEATNGNVSLIGEIKKAAADRKFTLALAFGGHGAEAGQQARAGLLQDFASVRDTYVNAWRDIQRRYIDLGAHPQDGLDVYRVSTAVLQIHESKRFPGAVVAGLAIPWGFDRGDEDIGGYHVIWPRDMVQAAMGKLACGDADSARRALFYLKCTQESDGNWPQNMWLDGTPNWTATQMDGTSFGVVLADALRRQNELGNTNTWPMIRSAAGFLVRNGPVTQQERWEENSGYSPNTMAIEIAALLAAAEFAEKHDGHDVAEFLRVTADAWNEAIDEFTYAADTDLARKHGVPGYYLRISPPEVVETGLNQDTPLHLKNLPDDRAHKKAVDIVSPDALALVRFGLRAADDPRMVNTVKVIDAAVEKQVSNGPVWHRYTDDGYGENPDGSAFDKTGQGRGWPLLAGERAHYEIARGNFTEAEKLLKTMAAQTSECGLIPEQVWDANDIPQKGLRNGHPTGSGMPLVWAHAEYIKLLRSLKERKVWDMPPQPVERYQVQKKTAPFQIWTFGQQRSRVREGKNLRIDCLKASKLRWTADHWKTTHDAQTTDSSLGVHYAMLSSASLERGTQIEFTFFWTEAGKWEGRNFTVGVI